MLKNEKTEEPQLKLSKTLADRMDAHKKLFQDNFNKILCKIDEIMNNLLKLSSAYNMGWGNNNISSHDYPKPAEEQNHNHLLFSDLKLK